MTRDEAAVNLAIASVLEAEGGLVYSDIDGGTFAGIRQPAWDAFLADHNAVERRGIPPDRWPSQISQFAFAGWREIGQEAATAFYHWYLTGCSFYHDIRRVRPLVPMVMLAHCQVLMGHSAGVRVMQRALNGTPVTMPTLKTDGKIGPKTEHAIDAVSPRSLVTKFERRWKDKIDSIINANPKKAVYHDGWMNRASGWSEGRKP